MAVTLANGNLLTVRLFYQVEGITDFAMNVLHYRVDGLTGLPATPLEGLEQIAQDMYDAWAGPWALAASEDVKMQFVTVSNVFPLPRSVQASHSPALPTEGAIASEPLPLQDCPTLLKKTSIGARWGMGRLFYVGTPESHQDSGSLTGAGITALASMITRIFTPVVSIGTGWNCTLRPVLLRGPEDNPVSITDIEDAVLSNSVLKTQRRRRPGKGS